MSMISPGGGVDDPDKQNTSHCVSLHIRMDSLQIVNHVQALLNGIVLEERNVPISKEDGRFDRVG